MNKILTLLSIIVFMSSCTLQSTQNERYEEILTESKSKLNNINSNDGINLNEAKIIFSQFAWACDGTTAFHVGPPIKYNGMWLSQVSLGDIAVRPTTDVIELDPTSGKLSYKITTISHFSNIWIECEAVKAKDSLHRNK